jgi:DNA-binding transcriptional ArsR family regulator
MNSTVSSVREPEGSGEGSGEGGPRPATTVCLTTADMARVRFGAVPAPLVETALGFAELRHQSRRRVQDSWASQARKVFPRAARPLLDLIPASGPWPEFLDPTVGDLDEALEIVSATSRSRMRYQLTISWRRPGRPPTWLRALADGDLDAMTLVVQALRAFYLACVAPAWPQIATSFHDEMTDRAVTLAKGGLSEFFDALHPDLAFRDGSLERSKRALARAGRPGKFHLGGKGLQVLPSMLWTGPPLFSIHATGPLANTMVYSGRPSFRALNGPEPPALDALLGRTRARVLHTLHDPCNTTELAARMGISASAASQHAATLRGAGLIRTERNGSNVRHSLTARGYDLLSGARNLAGPAPA